MRLLRFLYTSIVASLSSTLEEAQMELNLLISRSCNSPLQSITQESLREIFVVLVCYWFKQPPLLRSQPSQVSLLKFGTSVSVNSETAQSFVNLLLPLFNPVPNRSNENSQPTNLKELRIIFDLSVVTMVLKGL